MDENNDFEKFPGNKIGNAGERAVVPEQDFAKSFEAGVPEFAGDVSEKNFGTANPENLYYGEAEDDESETGEEYDAGIADAAALINYGLNAAAREIGVEAVVQKIKGFDASGREDPIKDLFEYLGVNTPEEHKEMVKENEAAVKDEQEFRGGVNAPSARRSVEGAFKALDDMKELIREVEGADPRYEELREGARAAGKGYFEYAVKDYGVQGLTELFGVLAQQREKVEKEADKSENAETDEEETVQEELSQEKTGEDEPEEETIEAGGLKEEKAQKEFGQRETLNPEILKPNET